MIRSGDVPGRPEHVPVLLPETVEALRPFPGGLFVDGTLGPGGHAEAVLKDVRGIEAFVGIDRDGETLASARTRLAGISLPSRFAHGDFRDLVRLVGEEWLGRVGGVLLDLGVSSIHLDDPERGFSHGAEGPLDMRMNRRDEKSAFDVVNGYDEKRLADTIRRYGEERNARAIAREIVRERESGPIRDTARLARAAGRRIPARMRTKGLSRVFQAIRIEVNDELGALESGLDGALELLAPGGRLVVIAYHSLEDRIVKERFRQWERGCVCPPRAPVCLCGRGPLVRLPHRRAIRPGAEETARNPRARSARLRTAEKLGGGAARAGEEDLG
ncbi:MAG: 16S rRNA (cytosine(1402)-N(4))-methyltransferase RsmH [Candidatus Eisenbacteria bacterium]|nr:16S rRNA (cytosine(1402)-N(4))-methyltransferase RsmH [Candidatus Eisenbacteria bacterium]